MPGLPRLTLLVGFLVAAMVCSLVPARLVAGQGDEREGQGFGGQREPYAAQFGDLLSDLDAFWADSFRGVGAAYRPARVVPMEGPVQTGCGPAGPANFAFYCPSDETIYYSVAGFAIHEQRFGDFAPIVVTAHEWGHHVQWLLGVPKEAGNAFELQADCLAGAYANDAAQRGLLDPGDLTEAVYTSADAGDDPLWPQDQPGAHGTNDDRITAFMRGYLDGIPGCNLPIEILVEPPRTPVPVPDLEITAFLPAVPPLAHSGCFRVLTEGGYTLAEVVTFLEQAGATPAQIQSWRWQDGAYRDYDCQTPPPGSADRIEVVVHRFGDPASARAAVPYFVAGYATARTEARLCDSAGSLQVCVWGRSPFGPPTADVQAVLQQVLAVAALPPDDMPQSPQLPLPPLLPDTLSLPQGQPLRLYEAGAATIDDLASGFPNPAEAARLLHRWGWEENAYRIFAMDGPPPDAAGWVELHVHRFATVDGAAEALPYFAQGRMATAGLRPLDLGLFGDQAAALAGPAYNGDEVTIYARRGNVLVRATGIAPNGDPTADVIEAILMPLWQLVDEPRVVSPELFATLPAISRVPPGLRLAAEHGRSASSIARTFPDPAEAERRFQAWGWRESAARDFVADGAGTAVGTTRLEMSVFRLADRRAAAAALPYFLDARAQALRLSEVAAPQVGDEARAIAGPTAGGREATVYFRVGASLFRVTAIGPGDPMVDLEAVLG